MNNFTKEELYDLKYCIEKFKTPAKDELGFYNLRDKIQSMIDNYCEHEMYSTYTGYDVTPIYCSNCDMIIKEE